MGDSSASTLPNDLPVLPSGWNWKELHEFVSKDRGICYGIVQPGQAISSGIPVIRVKDIRDGRIETRDALCVAAEVENNYKRSRLKGGELLLTLVGTMGEVAIAPPDLAGFNVARAVGVLPVTNADYLSHVLRAPVAQHYMRSWANTTVQATLNLKDVSRLPIPTPPLAEQRRIAEILGALDDKIELNRKMNKTLEEMAQAVFQDVLAGCDPTEGRLPTGWTLKTLGEAAKESGGAVQTGPFGSQLHASDYVDDGIPSVMPKDLKDDRISTTDVARVPEADAERLFKHRLLPGDVIYSRRGDVERRALVLEREAGWLCGTGCLRVRLGAASYNPHFLYQYLGLPTIRAWIARHAQGATMPNLNTKILGSLPFCIPSHNEQERIGGIVGSLHLKREANFAESETLAELRDTLLPKLISGELRVPDAECTVKEAV